jgi:molybdopterin converting factor small subunit
MTITIHLFGPLRIAAGRCEVPIEVGSSGTTCGDLRARLMETATELVPMLPACRFAVNHCFAAEDQVVGEGDEIALIGMTSGG